MEFAFSKFFYLSLLFVAVLITIILFYNYGTIKTEVESSEDKFLTTSAQEKPPKRKTDYEKGEVAVEATIIVDFDESKQVFTINGKENPKLTFVSKDGSSSFYEFQNVSNHPLYFGTTEEGFPDMSDAINLYKGSPKSLTEGSIFMNFDRNTPGTFYYNSPLLQGAGGKIQFIKTA